MPDALHQLLPALDEIQVAAVSAYLLATAAFCLGAGITLGRLWGRR